MVRLVFRPYTQIRRSICTSEPLRASTRVSSGFTLFRHSSPSFGSKHTCSCSTKEADPTKPAEAAPAPKENRLTPLDHFHYALGFYSPRHSHAWLTPWSVFQDGSIRTV